MDIISILTIQTATHSSIGMKSVAIAGEVNSTSIQKAINKLMGSEHYYSRHCSDLTYNPRSLSGSYIDNRIDVVKDGVLTVHISVENLDVVSN